MATDRIEKAKVAMEKAAAVAMAKALLARARRNGGSFYPACNITKRAVLPDSALCFLPFPVGGKDAEMQ
jgi:hypothetical protein